MTATFTVSLAQFPCIANHTSIGFKAVSWRIDEYSLILSQPFFLLSYSTTRCYFSMHRRIMGNWLSQQRAMYPCCHHLLAIKELAGGQEYLHFQTIVYWWTLLILWDRKEMEDAFEYIDVDAPQSATLRALLLKCSITPKYVMNKDGRHMLSLYDFLSSSSLTRFILLSTSFSKDLYLTIFNNLPNTPLSFAQSYGTILLDAWLQADMMYIEWLQTKLTRQRTLLENDIIQNIVTKCVYSKNVMLLKSLLELLNVFNKMKADPQIDDMLFRMYRSFLLVYSLATILSFGAL